MLLVATCVFVFVRFPGAVRSWDGHGSRLTVIVSSPLPHIGEISLWNHRFASP